jgi:co-chaperonin GroES (HSP10)
MKSIRDFIVHIPNRYQETFKTESGLELYGDHRWTSKEQANTVVKVVEIPCNYKGNIKKGYEVLIDPTIVFNQMYQKTGVAESHHLIDKDNNYYKVGQSMIILYRKDDKDTWKGHADNIVTEQIKEDLKQVKQSIIISLETPKNTFKKGIVKVVYANEFLNSQDVFNGDIIYVDEMYGVNVFVDGKKYVWYNTRYVIAKKLVA